MFPTDNRKLGDYKYEKYASLDKFFQNKKVHISCGSYYDVITKFKNNKSAFMFLDPPYFDSNNTLYYSAGGNSDSKQETDDKKNVIDNTGIYSDIGDLLNNKKSFVMTVLNSTALIKYCYKGFLMKEYNKQYNMTQKKIVHCVFANFWLD